MGEKDVVVTLDWAMKFLPRKYREGTIDWFGKRGLNWHIAVTLMKRQERFKTVTHIHIFREQTTQDAATTLAVIADVVADLKEMVPDLGLIHLFSDNAGCYKSSLTILSLHRLIGTHLASYNFCESQNGKGSCDRRAANAKAAIRRYVNEGHDVTSAEEMKTAIDKMQKTKSRVKVVDTVEDVDANKKLKTLANITSLFNFQYEETGLRVWQAYAIGTGKVIPWEQYEQPMTKELKVHQDWTDVAFTGFQNEEHHQQQHQNFLDCPNSDCSKQFRSSKTLEEHVLLGDCELEPEHRSLVDMTKITYARKLEHNEQTCCTIPSNTTTSQSFQSDIQMGWALKVKKKSARFTEEQKHFMREKFKIGKRTGSKVDPYTAAEEMMHSGQFDRKHFLSAQQIASYFSRLSQKERKLDINSAKVESAQAQLKEEIVADCDLEILEA